ncbi:MAG: PilZ domain-containing protein [Syntrophales bacterium]|jgi:c-di-GMP-binding flagellar brake protein YcgR|nr:PilZ domain-containing protein [Syntrophales bacterium]MDX9921989.1 PilZ domain-containing protein [Syntrophales bacterium]
MAIRKQSTLKSADARKHPRYSAPEGTLVIVSPGSDKEWTVQAIDISAGGMAFIYRGSPDDLDKSGVLKILAKNAELENITFDTVSDIQAPQAADSSIPLRRRGVKFKWMGEMKTKDLQAFMKHCCT